MEALLDEWLWQEEYWLPPGISWQDIKMREDEGHVPLPRDLVYTLPLAFAFIALRYVFERVIAVPLSRRLGVKDRVRIRAASVPKLEAFYKHNGRQPSQPEELKLSQFYASPAVSCSVDVEPNGSSIGVETCRLAAVELVSLGKQCGLSQGKIQTWFRHRRNQDRPSNTKKFCEASWRFVFYLASFTAGLASLIHTPWFWDQTECWRGYPKQPVAEPHYWYYVLELSFYLSLLLCVSVDVKRKDFKEQVIHHIATIFLIGFSYCANYVRVGTLVMLVHDSSDFLLESAKMFHYAGWTRTCDSLFVVFAAVFLVTRLVVFPGRVIHTTLVVSVEFFEPFFGYYFFNALLLVLQILHIFWAYLILRMVYKFVFMGKVERDERSDEESEVEDEEEPEEEGDECSWEQRKGAINSKLASLANNCVLNNLTNQRNINSRLPKAR